MIKRRLSRPSSFQQQCTRMICIAMMAVGLAGPQLVYAQPEGDLAKDSSTEINIKNADIAAVVRIFSKRTKRNYILDERVKGKVTIYLPGKVSSDEAIRILDSVLGLKGFTSVPIGDNLWKIIPAREAKQTTIPTIDDTDGRGSPSIVTRLVNLKYVSADDVKQLLSPLVSGNGLLNAYTGTNSLIMIDSEENIQRLVRIIQSIDIPSSDREMTIIPIKHADATDIAEKVTDILSEGEGDGSNAAQQNLDFMRGRLGQSSARRTNTSSKTAATSSSTSAGSTITVSARAREPKIISDERTNSVIVVADEDTTSRIRALISELDSQTDLSGNRFYVYRCQHANAEDLADVLGGLTGGGGTSTNNNSSLSNRNSSSSTTGNRSRGNRFQRTQDRLSGQQRTPGRSRTENGSGSSGPTTVSFGEDVSITADPATNSLIISAGKTDYQKIKELLGRLDVKRRQVLVEALLLEVGITDTLSMGTEWITSGGGDDGGAIAINNGGNLQQLFTNPSELSQFSIAAASAGTLELPGGITIPSQTLLVRAAQNASNVNVLSAPTILATDNEDAEIVVGQNVPFLASTSTSSDNLNNTFNQIDRQDVGITLRITPQISSGDFVTLRLFTEVSNVIPGTESSELGPTTTIRTSETTVITKNSQMIVTGGLMSDDIQESESGIPFLKDIPVLGHAFKERVERQSRTNLLIFLTPRIIKDQFDARDATLRNRDILQKDINNYDVYPPRNEFLERMEIDRVTEAEVYNGKKPGTIFEPSKKSERAQLKLGPVATSPKSNTKSTIDASGDSPISIEVSPALPSRPGQSGSVKTTSGTAHTSGTVTASIGASVPVAAQLSASGQAPVQVRDMFVVLEGQSPKGSPKNLPFKLSSEQPVLGIVVPKDTNTAARRFFKAGSEYRYSIEGADVPLKVVGIFRSPSEAANLFENLGQNWHNMSPYEIMNIGNGPWFRQ